MSRGDRSEYLLGWDHESGDLLFNTFDNGSVSVWRQAMTRGRPSGPPRLVRSEVWGMGIGAVGIARGSIYYFVSNREMQVMTGAVDLESGLLTSVPSPASRSYQADWIALPTWSPDGSVLAYYRKTFNPVMNRIHLRNSAGEERTLTLPVTHVDVLHWEATGSHLTVGVRHRTGRRLMRVDVFSGAYEYVETDDEAVPNAFLDALQSGDRWRFAYRTENQDDGIVVRDLRTGATRTVWEKPASGSRPSPDDEWLAFRSRDDDTGLWNSIWIVSAAPGEPRKLFSAPAGRGVSAPTWSRDGKFLVLVDRDEERTTVYAVPMAGGDPRPVLVSDVNVMGIAFHPDGRRFAYATHGDESRDDAVWALDLPGATIQSPPPIASTR